jgi:hypothetical protein
MKKIIIATILVLTTVSCTQDLEYIDIPKQINNTLTINGAQGLKLESYVVTNQVKINSKLPIDGNYKIKIYDFNGEIVSQEKIEGKEGDNILNIYVSALPISSYSVELQTADNKVIGREYFSIQSK